jgi:hypothetical protein
LDGFAARADRLLSHFKNTDEIIFRKYKSVLRVFSTSRGTATLLRSVPNAHRHATKSLKTLKMASASYWQKLARAWDRRHVRSGSAPFCDSLGTKQIRPRPGRRSELFRFKAV